MDLVKKNGNGRMWRPFDLLAELHDDMNRFLRRGIHSEMTFMKSFEPEMDLIDEKDQFVVRVDLPGIKKEELEIKVSGNALILKGERKQEKETRQKDYYASERFYGSFSRSIAMPADVKAEEVKAVYKDGVLEVTLPKTDVAKSKEVSVAIK